MTMPPLHEPSPFAYVDEEPGVPNHLSPRQFSAFGSEHPTDIALGWARRLGDVHQIAKGGKMSHGERLQAAVDVHKGAHQMTTAHRVNMHSMQQIHGAVHE